MSVTLFIKSKLDKSIHPEIHDQKVINHYTFEVKEESWYINIEEKIDCHRAARVQKAGRFCDNVETLFS